MSGPSSKASESAHEVPSAASHLSSYKTTTVPNAGATFMETSVSSPLLQGPGGHTANAINESVNMLPSEDNVERYVTHIQRLHNSS